MGEKMPTEQVDRLVIELRRIRDCLLALILMVGVILGLIFVR